MNFVRLVLIRRFHSPLQSSAFATFSSPSSDTSLVLKLGDVLRLTRAFTDADVADYARVSGDFNPVHFDAKFARSVSPQFQGHVVHGMLVASLFPAVIASHFPGAVYVSQTLQFKLPVYMGEEVTAEVVPTNIKEHRKRYIAKFLIKCHTNTEMLVIDGEAMAVLPTLNGLPEAATHAKKVKPSRVQ